MSRFDAPVVKYFVQVLTPCLTIPVVALALSVGCSESDRELIDVQGRITHRGKPVVGAVLGFTPTQSGIGHSQRPATAITDHDGIYRIKAYRSEFGMPPGDYQVTVLSYEGSMAEPATVRYLVAKEYSDPSTSGLVANIPSERSGTLELDFDLK